MPTNLSGTPILKWRNRNILSPLQINIYRSLSPMDINNMPTPYDTISGDQSQYVDMNVLYGETYFYRIGIVGDGIEKIIDDDVPFTIGDNTLKEPFDLEATFYENDSSVILSSTESIGYEYDKYIGTV